MVNEAWRWRLEVPAVEAAYLTVRGAHDVDVVVLASERIFDVSRRDFNLTEAERPSLYALGASVGLVDVCAQLGCPEPWRLDRVLIRSSRARSLQPHRWHTDRSFRDAKGQPLSDHLLVAVDLDWVTRD